MTAAHPHTDVDRQLGQIADIDLDALRARAHDAIELERRWPTRPDGFPTRTPGAAPATGHTTPSDVQLTIVETAAQTRLYGRDDPDTRAVRRALADIATAASHLTAARTQLARLEARRGGHILPERPPTCWALARVGGYATVRSTVLIDDQWIPLGQWAYKFHRRTGRLPTLDECRDHLAGRRITTTPKGPR